MYKIPFLQVLFLWLAFLPSVMSQLYEPSGRTSNNIFRSRNSFAVKPQPSRQRSYSTYVKEPAEEFADDQETKDMINSFLVRESRNSFIGKRPASAAHAYDTVPTNNVWII